MSEPLTFLAVHAHPDDESIGTGGTFVRYAAEGIRTALVCCTRGEEGENYDPALDPVASKPRLGEIREGELRAAAAILGISTVHVLGYRDSGMAGWPSNADPRAFVNADLDAAAARLAAIVRTLRPQVVVTYDAGGGYGHPDHKMAHRVTLRALELAARDGASGAGGDETGWSVARLYYTAISLSALLRVNEQMAARGLEPPFRSDQPEMDIRQFAAPDESITARVDVRGTYETVLRALRAHRTQIRADDVMLRIPADIAAEAFAMDHYIRAMPPPSAGEIETDLFAGLR